MRQNSTDEIDYLSLRYNADDGRLFNAIFLQSKGTSLASYVDQVLEFRTRIAEDKDRKVTVLERDVRTGIAALVYSGVLHYPLEAQLLNAVVAAS